MWRCALHGWKAARDVNDESPANAPGGMVVSPFSSMILWHFPSFIQKRRIALETNSSFIVLPAVIADPKQLGRPLISAVSCPLLLARQQSPNSPSAFALHNFSKVALSAARSSAAVTRDRTETNARKEKAGER